MIRRSVCALAALLALAACEEDTALHGVKGQLHLDLTQLNLGYVQVGQTATATATLMAVGAGVSYQGQFLSGTTEFQATPASGQVQVGQKQTVTVRFTPTVMGRREAALRYTATDAKEAQQLDLQITAEAFIQPDCEDGNACTEDAFDPNLRRCTHTPNTLPCNDLSACTTDDRCANGVCTGTPVSCDDGDACTADYCDPLGGCQNKVEVVCNDHNACTADTCQPDGSCVHTPRPAGSACVDMNPCGGSECNDAGQCIAGTPRKAVGEDCDDKDPCTKAKCTAEFKCVDKDAPGFAEVKFKADLASFPLGNEKNPILDGSATLYVPTGEKLTAIDRCGETTWTSEALVSGAQPDFEPAIATPGRLLVPYGVRVVSVRADNGTLLVQPESGTQPGLDLEAALKTLLKDDTLTDIKLVDLALRNGLGYMASLSYKKDTETRGALVEVDRSLKVPTLFQDLKSQVALRLLVDRDGSLVALLSREDGGSKKQQVRRFGLDNHPTGSWQTAELTGEPGDISLGPDGEVYWTEGLVRLDRDTGRPELLTRLSTPNLLIVGDNARFFIHNNTLTALKPNGETDFTFTPDGETLIGSPATDSAGAVFVLSRTSANEAKLYALKGGTLLDKTPITLGPVTGGASPTLTLSNARAILAILPQADGKATVYAVQWNTQLSSGAWPRYRHDNYATQHR